MEVIRTIRPGMPGGRLFEKHWGESLIAVRYRRGGRKVYTTIEVIVDEREQAGASVSLNSAHALKRQQVVAVLIAYEEHVIRAAAKQTGARWSVKGRAWLMTYSIAVSLGLQRRIVEGLAEKCTDVEMFLE